MYLQSSQMATFDHQPALRKTPDQSGSLAPSKKKIKEIVLYKTEYCRNWSELGYCRSVEWWWWWWRWSSLFANRKELPCNRYGEKCRYAHGENELRHAPRHMLYKTQICRAYHDKGECPYGIRCTFIHGESYFTLPPANTVGLSPGSLSSSTTSCSSSSIDDDFCGVSLADDHSTSVQSAFIRHQNSSVFSSSSYIANFYGNEYVYPYIPLHSYSLHV